MASEASESSGSDPAVTSQLTTVRSRSKRLPLGATPKRLSFERRLRLWLTFLALPFLIALALLLFRMGFSVLVDLSVVAFAAGVWAIVALSFFDGIIRPLQTLSNIVVALREDDFSFRARGARRGDALGDLALEINALAANLQQQRSEARDAVSLAERVISSMMSPVLAFDPSGSLRVMNTAAERTFALERKRAYGQNARELGLEGLIAIADGGLFTLSQQAAKSTLRVDGAVRWFVRRTGFRLRGVPHTLLVLSDVDAALREEERLAFQRLIRVLGHEINNSLTPIKSIAGTLRLRLPKPALHGASEAQSKDSFADFHRGLTIIEERAASLNRFLQAYQQISRLPVPAMRPFDLRALAEQVAQLETRLPIAVQSGPSLTIVGDPDQLQQLLINLLLNAVDAALSSDSSATGPEVAMAWSIDGGDIVIRIRDNGPGLANPRNLFVPFYTTKANGTGIGLVLAEQIATAHRGTVRLTNRIDSTGCDAEIRLPLT